MLPPTRQIDRLWQSDWSLSGLLAFLILSVFVVRPLEVLGYDIHLVAAVAFSFILVTGIITVSRSRITTLIFGSIAVSSVRRATNVYEPGASATTVVVPSTL